MIVELYMYLLENGDENNTKIRDIRRNVSAVTYLYCNLSPIKMYIIEWDIDIQI